MKKLLAVAVALFVGAALTVAGTANAGGRTKVKPTIVFVHGAFADASGFGDSISSLQKQGYTVLAPPNPLRSLSGDAASIRTFLGTVPGPIVLVGHSYGGAVITNAASGNPNVKALVYIAAYALDEGESVAAANQLGGGHTDIEANLDFRPYPGAPPLAQSPTGYDLDAYIKQSSFRALFAADVPPAEAAVMAAAQRPGTLITLGEPSGVPAWKTIPSWYLVARNDKTIPPEAERAMAARAKAHTIELATSHAAMVSHPQAVTSLVLSAVRATG
ncbi:alpha/beta hydrolase [Winogradskya humida]|uniref:Alpha/beta hydrolase n=1 Tax=Winogradskya humida TaxID=113566 RepID=A0ABQ4A069_9ACTN|nr:alpha/beta hydrolase [Actinoplanes humidus]GIE24269.1 alpha/beta hydrolase [Actinoplanes humidus]